MSKINVETVLQSYSWYWNTELFEKDSIKAAIKEIVEKVVDECADKAKTKFRDDVILEKTPSMWDIQIDKQSILKIKEEVEYE